MTETEWRTCGCRVQMRRALRLRRFPPFRWVRFNLACIDRVRELIDDARCFELLDKLERCTVIPHHNSFRPFYNEETGVRAALPELWQRRDDPLRSARVAVARAVQNARQHTLATSEMVALGAHRRSYDGLLEKRAHCKLFREVFGNPFRPVAFSSSWRTDTAVSLARTMYESREFGAMPILADALQDAGCDNADILDHCRDTALTHVRGCWVVDLVLGRE